MKTLVILKCGRLRCALERGEVSELAPLPELSHPPSLPGSVEGIMNLGGGAILVVDLGKLFGEAADAEIDPIYRHVVVLRGQALGLLVDRVEDVRVVDETKMLPASRDISLNECVMGQIEVGGTMVHLLDAGRILMAAEQARFDEIREAEQARLDGLEPA